MTLGELPDYPWDQLTPYIERAKAHPAGAVDLSIGSPVDPTPEIVRTALREHADAHSYPTTIGTNEARDAVVAWFARSRGVTGLERANTMLTVGSKEFVATAAFFLRLGVGDTVVYPSRAYPTYEIGAVFAGATRFAGDDPAAWPESTKLIWLNSPGNPDGRVLGVEELRAAVDRARELGAVIINDECYAELGWGDWAGERIPSILDERVNGGDFTNILACSSLSKRSNLAGYRAAYIAGDSALISRLLVARKHAGLIPPAAGAVHADPVLGQGLGADPMRWKSRELLTRIGTVFQDPEHQLLASTVRGELEIGPRALGLDEATMNARIEPLLERLRLDRLARANPYTLSGGEKRRLTVAAALATAPRMLVLDEPTFGQDSRTWAELVALLAELRDEGTGIVVVTHDDDVVRALHAERFVLGGAR